MDESERKRLKREIARQRSDGLPLADQFRYRIKELSNGRRRPLDLAAELEWFPEVGRALSLKEFKLGLVGGKDRSEASLTGNGKLEIIGFLHDPAARRLVAKFGRTLLLEQGCANHELFEVEPDYRGRGICLRLLRESFRLYDALGLGEVQVEASLSTGRWFWARVGFEFARREDLEEVRGWVGRVRDALGLKLTPQAYSSAAQFARMGGNRLLSFAQLAAVLPDECDYAEIAAQNGVEFEQRIEFARTVMLAGPEWKGRMALGGPARRAFEIAVDCKKVRVRQGG